jgi:hypothetical protein
MFTHLLGQLIKSLFSNKLTYRASLIAGLIILLGGCAATPQTQKLLVSPPDIPIKYEIADVPFYPQQEYFCGPATLSEVFNYYDLKVSQTSIAPDLFIPDLEGSLQIEMIAAVRQHGFLAYTQEGNLEQLFSLVSQNTPVIVLQNNSIAWYPMWHYSLVIGYDLTEQKVIMHSANIKRHTVSFDVFERTWQRGRYWLLAAVPTNKTSQHFDSFIYTRSAQDLLSVGKILQGVSALKSATLEWPEYWLPYFLLGNHYLDSNLKLANYWYQQGYPFAQSKIAFLNNFAYALNQSGCQALAINVIQQALLLSPKDSNLLDTQQEIRSNLTESSCDIPNQLNTH